MRVLIYLADHHGPELAATIPDGIRGEPRIYAVPGADPSARASLLSKGSALSWAAWAHHLVRVSPTYGGQWLIQDVPAHWQHSPNLLRNALREAADRHGLL